MKSNRSDAQSEKAEQELSATERAALIEAMSQPEFYPEHPAQVEYKQTHISSVFIAGESVYKVKKRVHFPFLDCSKLARRFHFCLEEVRLNARLSPGTYLGVFAIKRDAHGFAIAPNATEASTPGAVEYAVKMRRLPDDRMLDRLVAARAVDNGAIRRIVARMVKFHASASHERGVTYGSAEAVSNLIVENLAEIERFVGNTLDQGQFRAIDEFSRGFAKSHRELLDQRAREGRVREGHGDLRCEHVCLRGDQVDVIDCVEFSEQLRYGDVANEIAFLAMDLDRLGAPHLSEELVAAYTEMTGDEEFALLMPAYKCYRATVRGKVESLRSLETEVSAADRKRAAEAARAYFALACSYARRSTPALVVVCGRSGTGKSTLALALKRQWGFVVINSDRVRKRLAAIPEHAPVRESYGAGIYSKNFSKATYDAMLSGAQQILRQGSGAILDATFKDPLKRNRVLELAARMGVPVLFIECVLDEQETLRRLEKRAAKGGEVSDATPEIYQQQNIDFVPITEIPKDNHVVVDMAEPMARIVEVAGHSLERLHHARGADRVGE